MDRAQALEKMQKLKILFVDDEENVLSLMTGILADLNVNFTTTVLQQGCITLAYPSCHNLPVFSVSGHFVWVSMSNNTQPNKP